MDVNNSGTIENNVFKNIRTFTITVNSGNIFQNEVISGSFEITLENKGDITNNIFNNSGFNIDTNDVNSAITNNTSNTSVISVITNQADIAFNTLENQSRLLIGTNLVGGGIKYFNITNLSSVQLGNVSQIIGTGAKGGGVNVSNASILKIDTFSPTVVHFTET